MKYVIMNNLMIDHARLGLLTAPQHKIHLVKTLKINRKRIKIKQGLTCDDINAFIVDFCTTN